MHRGSALSSEPKVADALAEAAVADITSGMIVGLGTGRTASRAIHALGERVKEVRVTHRLTDSPACLVVGEGELSGNLERLLKDY